MTNSYPLVDGDTQEQDEQTAGSNIANADRPIGSRCA